MAEFKNNPYARLKLHGRAADKEYLDNLKKKIRKSKTKNIEIINQVLSATEYLEFLKSLDCMVVLSRGEGFSVPPREALALGLPCILAYNTAHKTLCKSGLFCCVPSQITQPSLLPSSWGYIGNDFNCTVQDVRKALREVYNKYNYYLEKAHEGRSWVQQYTWNNLKPRIINLIKPKKILYGDQDSIANDYFMTKSQVLFKKYTQLYQKQERL